MEYQAPPPGKDPHLWQLACRRASFKKHLSTYLVINGMLWLLWLLTRGDKSSFIPWPAWSTLGWGIGLFFHFLGAYVTTGMFSVEKEYEKLQNQTK